MKLVRPWLAIVVLSIGAGCASARNSVPLSPLLRGGWQPVESQECALINFPPALPSPEALLEVSRLTSVLGASSVGQGASSYAVFEMMYDSAGRMQRMRVVEADMDSVSVQQVSSLLLPQVRGEPPLRARWGTLVKVSSGDGVPEVSIGRMEYCACALINRAEFTQMLIQLTRETRIPGVTGRRQIAIQVRSDSTGAILEKRLGQSTGSLALDRMVFDLADAMKVAPPLLNRRPLNGWSQLPIILNFPAQ